MKGIKYLISKIVICLIAFTNLSYAQQTRTQAISRKLDQTNFTIRRNTNNSIQSKGSPYINKNFEVIKLKKYDNQLFLGRYDANLAEMQIKRKNDTIVLHNSEDYEVTFTSSNKTYKTYNYTNEEGHPKQGFLVVLFETESLAVLKEEKIKFFEAKPPSDGYDKAKPAEYVRVNDIYYFRLGDTVSYLPKKRKDFLNLFPKHSNKIKIFIKKNKISLKDDEDLIYLFKYIETL